MWWQNVVPFNATAMKVQSCVSDKKFWFIHKLNVQNHGTTLLIKPDGKDTSM